MNTVKERNSSIELLRIISMILIMFHHFAYHGNFTFNNVITIPRLWYNFIMIFGKVGVNIFVFISAYFLCTEKEIHLNIKKIIKLWLQILLYSIINSLLFKIFKNQEINWIQTFMPITYKAWWFASTYFVLYIIHPYINKLIYVLNKKEHQILLILMLILWSIIPTFTNMNFEGNDLIWFITIYIIASYIRIYMNIEKISTKKILLALIISILIIYSLTIFCSFLGTKNAFFDNYFETLLAQRHPIILLISLCMFILFLKINIKQNKIINIIASATFGVYLIHDSEFFRTFLWKTYFKVGSYSNNNLIIIYSILIVLLVYIITTLIDLIRKYTLEKLIIKLINKKRISLKKSDL